MTLPNRRLSVSPDRRRAARGGRRSSDRPGRHPTVLVADAYDDARAPVARYLDRFGFRVFEAANATDAVLLWTDHRPTVILSGLRGAQAALLYDKLSAPPVPASAPSIVIVLVSSIDDPVPAEATGVLTKPFSLRLMLDELRREMRALAAREAGRRTVKKRAGPRKNGLSS